MSACAVYSKAASNSCSGRLERGFSGGIQVGRFRYGDRYLATHSGCRWPKRCLSSRSSKVFAAQSVTLRRMPGAAGASSTSWSEARLTSVFLVHHDIHQLAEAVHYIVPDILRRVASAHLIKNTPLSAFVTPFPAPSPGQSLEQASECQRLAQVAKRYWMRPDSEKIVRR